MFVYTIGDIVSVVVIIAAAIMMFGPGAWKGWK